MGRGSKEGQERRERVKAEAAKPDGNEWKLGLRVDFRAKPGDLIPDQYSHQQLCELTGFFFVSFDTCQNLCVHCNHNSAQT